MLDSPALVLNSSRHAGVLGCTFGALGSALLIVWLAPCTAMATDTVLSDACPSRESTLAAVNALLGKSAIGPEERAAIKINDLGTHFTITVNTKTRDYEDNARDCAQRARMAAVFVALTLAPPDIAGSDEPVIAAVPSSSAAAVQAPPPPPPTAAPTHSSSPPPPPTTDKTTHEMSAQFELGVKAAYDPAHSQTDFGALARVAVTASHWGASLGADVPARGSFELHGVRVQQGRYSADVAARYAWFHDAIEVRLDVGPSLTWLQLKQADSPAAERVMRWLPGLRSGAVLLFEGRTISPFIGADMTYLPFRIPIIVEPEGTIGHTSLVWIGASVGIAIATH